MATLSTFQKFKEEQEKKKQGGQQSPQQSTQQSTQQSGQKSTGLMNSYQQFIAKQQGQETAYTPESDYGQRVMDVIGKVGNSAASRNGEWTADASGGNAAEINALLREYDAYTGDKSGMTEYRNALLDYNKRIQAENQYYAGFGTKDDFNRVRSGYTNFGVGYDPQSYGLDDASARKLRQEAAQNDAKEAQRALAEYVAAKKAFTPVDQEYRIHNKGDSDGGAYSDEYEEDLNSRYNQARAKVTAAENALLSARNRMDAYNATWGKVDKYGETSEAAKGTDTSYTGPGYESIVDWENKKNEELAAQDAQAQRADYVPGTLRYTSDTEPVAEDRLGLWRSLTPEQKQDAVNSSNVQLNNVVMAGNDGYWDLLTDNEVETYYYIKGQQGQDAANQYLDDMYIELSRRNELKTVQSIENANSWEKAGLTAVSVGANLVGAIPAAMGKTADMVTGRTNPYSSMQFFQRYASYIRGGVGQDIGDWTESKLADKFGEQFAAKAGNLANQTFQALMSGVDSVAGGMSFGQGLALPAGPFNFHVGGYTTVMGMGGFAKRAQELELKGATPMQIAIGSIGSGILEALFEDVSMEVFFTNILDNPAKTAGEFVKKLAIQMGVEGSEEMFTEMGNIILDAINMGKNSENSMAVREYMAQGMTEEKARQQVWKDNAVDILWAGYGGAISAGAMAAGGQALSSGVNRVHSTVGNYAVGSQLLENGRAVDLQEQAESLTNEKKRAKLQKAAADVASNTSAGDKSFRNTYRTGKVATQIAQQAGREARGAETAEFRKAAEKYLEGQRGIQNKKHALNVLTRAYDGTAMLPGDKAYMRMIGGEKLTQEILNSVGGKETLQENAKPSVEASMRTIGNVQSSVLGIAPETKAEFDSDNSGQAFRKSDSEPINILSSEPIARVENGVLYLNTDDGKEIAASDVSYGNSGEAAVYAAISNMQTDTETARSLLSGIDDSGLSSSAYARAIQNAYYRGMNGVKFEDTPGYSDAAKLPETQRRAAWEAGKQRRAAKVQERESLIDSGKAGTRESGVTMQESAKSIRNLNKQQQTGMAAAKALAAAGLHVEVYASTEAERKAGKPNGVYRKADGSIAIDLNAGDNGQGAVAYALAHETTHFIQDYSPAKFETYAELIIAAAESKGISYDSLLARQLARLSEMEEYKNLSETELQDIAYDETIAEMSETILTDTDAASRLSQQIYKQDRTLWQKIKDFFTGLVEKLRNAYRDSDPDSEIGRMLKRAVQDNAEIAQAWAEAVREAGENYQLQDGGKNNAREGEMSDEALKNSPGDVKHSLRRNGELQQKAEKVNQKNGFVSEDVMAKAAEVRNAIADIMLDPELQESLGLPPDIEGNTFFADSSYGGSEENTTICPRSMGAEALLDAVSDLIGRPLTVDEQIVVSQEMQNRTANPECVYCYVATDRKAYREFLGEYIKQRDHVLKDASKYTDTRTYTKAQIDSMTDAQKANSLYVQFLNGRKPTKNMASRFKMWMDISASGKQLLQASDLTSISRLEELKAKDFSGITKDMAKQIKDAMRYAQSASWAKKRVGYTAYNGHILNWKQSRIDNLNSQYGLRMYSFSDFSPAFILENMQMVTDAATRGLKMLAYTKDLNFVKIFAKTGMNINVSCFGYEVGGNVYENNLQGAAWADAQKLRAENPNVGVVFVTYNDAMTKWAMQQEWVDVVIPYHLVRTGTKVAEAFGFTNYTDISGDKKITESWVKGQDEAHITPPMHENNLEKYLAACEENHLTPRFQKFLNDPEMRPYYMKLVNETRRSAQETPTVQPVFDQRSAEIALQDMRNEGGYFQPIGGSVDKMVDIAIEISEKIQKREVDKFSSRNARDAEGKTLTENQERYSARNQTESKEFKQWFGDWQNDPANASKVVNKDGTPKVLYHQTSADFTIFEPRHEGAGTRDQDTPFGIFMKSSDRNIGVKGEKQMALYARIVNPLRVTDRADLMYQLKKISPEYEKVSAELRSLNDEYQQKYDDAKEAFRDYVTKWRQKNPNASRTAIYDDAAFNEVYEAEDNVLDEWEAEARKVELRSKEAITRDLEKQGYDGVIIQTDEGSFGRSTDAYIALHPEQVKSATNNVGTFDRGNPDIRYSNRNSGESRVDRLVRKNEELKAEAEYLKQVVQIQKQGNRKNLRDRESVNAIAKGILESVNAKDTEFGKKLNDFYRDLVTVEMDYDTMQEKAGELADRALEHHQAERDGYAQEVLDFLKKRRVSLTESQIGDAEYTYGSLSEFKKAIRGSIILDQNSTTSLDQLWQEAAARFPDRFGADTTEADMPDGIANIVSWANSAEADSETEFQYYKAETKADLTRKILMGFLDAKPIESVSDTLKQQLADLKQQHKQEMQELRKSWDEEAKAMERSHRYDLEAERKRSKAAVEALKYQQEVIQKAQEGLWETERADIKRSYEKQMKELREQNSEDTGTMQKEFFRLLREYEKQQAKGDRQSAKDSDTISALREALSKEAQSHKEDSAAWNKEFSRLLREYETSGRKVDRLEAKVKQQREAAAQKVESRKKTEERHKLQNTIDTLNKYLLQPTNTAHVPQGLQSSVAMALRAINGVIGDSKAAQNADRLAEYAYRLRELEKNPSANGDKIADLNRKIQNLTGKDSSMKAALAELQEQYHKLETQGNNLYDSNIEALIQNTMEQIGDTEYRNLSLQQLKAVRDSYTALLTTIRNANKAFVAGQNARIDEMVKRATMELSLKEKKKPTQTAMWKKIDQFFWNNEKPVYAFERIGSTVMSELYNNLRKGEDTFYRDVSEARKFFLESAEKNGFSKWDLNEMKEFTAADGRKFQLSLDELMSLYAYSLRPQARDHLTKGGIVLAENTKRLQRGPLGVTREVTYDDANAYTLTDDTIDAIVGSLTKEQRQFAFEMQQYLAKVMGAKGDEVNMALYGIKKFGEETYWPLKSSGVFSERIREQQERTGNKVKNSGFTKALTQHANNAIELSSLTETWAQHVNDMSMYHAFTLPMEDFYRVYNWTQKGDSKGKQTMGVRQMIQQTAGKGAVTYIDQFLKDLNGGLRADPRETVSKAMLSGFKKAAVSASLSAAIQQPSAVGRALAYIEANYFLGGKVESAGGIKATWDQLKKYAAVAGLKEMGRFDVDMGKSTLEYIIGRNGLSTWGKITDKVDEYSGWLPEMADQVTWCAIWEAAKRKTQAQNPGLHGEALLQKAGELFTDTITRTQVYDSVFSRSANMRSKSGLMSMATAFMAEPTTTANMVEDAVRKFARGDKRMAGKVMSSVAVATVLNAALASVVYAARDDDDDKTYWEKYMASLAGETVDSFNPLTYIPVLSDINNLLLGYSIERTDMSLASDLITALKKITTLYGKYDDEWSDEKKKEWEKKVRDAWLDNAWMVGTVMGLPLKNVVRDVEAVINTARNPSNGAEMNADTVLKAMKDSARKNFPILSWKADESSSDQLYKAITQGKDVLARRLKAQFGDEKKYESALLKGLRENDPRIKTAAQYAIDGNTPKRVAIIREIVAEGHYTQDQVIKAINQKANSMKEKTQSGKESPPEKLYDYSEYVNAAANGLGYAGDVQKELIRYQADRNQENDGKLTRAEAEEAAENTFKSNVKSDAKDGYAVGELTEAQVRKVLTAADIAEDEELDDLILQWDTELELGREIDWGDTKYLEYAEEIRPAGISVDVYDEWLRQVNYYLTGVDEDGDGKADRNSAVKQKAAYINSLPLTAEQKEALWRTVSTSARTLRKYRLW
ncbi:MAG: hypothetical protein SPE19_10455 [Candidatus Faecousia sp.]|nr:hypothetical protein [Candidatus Faecousia sp.]